jgi:hypothetical protein
MNYTYRLCACTGRTGKRPAGHGAVGVRAPPHRHGDLDVGHSGRQVEHVGELASSFIVYGKVGQAMPAPPRPLPPGTTPFPSSSQRDGEWSSRAGGRSGARGERAAWRRSVRELGERFGSRNERTLFLTDDGLFTYHGFMTITTCSNLISLD